MSKSLVSFLNFQVKSGQIVVLRPFWSMYQEAHPPEFHTVGGIRFWMASFQLRNASSCTSTECDAAGLHPLDGVDDVADLRLDHVDDRVVAQARVRAEDQEGVGEARDRRALVRLRAAGPDLGRACGHRVPPPGGRTGCRSHGSRSRRRSRRPRAWCRRRSRGRRARPSRSRRSRRPRWALPARDTTGSTAGSACSPRGSRASASAGARGP